MDIQKSYKITIFSFVIIFLYLIIDNIINNKNQKIKYSYLFKISISISLYILILLKYIGLDNKNINFQELINTLPNF